MVDPVIRKQSKVLQPEGSYAVQLRCGAVALLIAAKAFLGICDASAQNTSPSAVSLDRLHEAVYRPGAEVEVSILINGASNLDLAAFGLYETVPPGWSLISWNVENNASPTAASPQPGATEVFEFAWIQVPTLPIRLHYRLAVPEGETGERFFSGQVEYFLTQGGRQLSTPALTSMASTENNAPTLQLVGEESMSIALGTPYVEPGYSARDTEDGDLTDSVVVEGEVDSTTAGAYSLNYSVSDSENLDAPAVTRVVTVLPEDANTTPDSSPPGPSSSASPYGNGSPGRNGSGAQSGPSEMDSDTRGSDSRTPALTPSLRVGQPRLPGTPPPHSGKKPGNSESDRAETQQMESLAEGSLTPERSESGNPETAQAKIPDEKTAKGPPGALLVLGFCGAMVVLLLVGWYRVHGR